MNKAKRVAGIKRRRTKRIQKRITRARINGTRLDEPEHTLWTFFQREVTVNPFGIPELTSFDPKDEEVGHLYQPSSSRFTQDKMGEHSMGLSPGQTGLPGHQPLNTTPVDTVFKGLRPKETGDAEKSADEQMKDYIEGQDAEDSFDALKFNMDSFSGDKAEEK